MTIRSSRKTWFDYCTRNCIWKQVVRKNKLLRTEIKFLLLFNSYLHLRKQNTFTTYRARTAFWKLTKLKHWYRFLSQPIVILFLLSLLPKTPPSLKAKKNNNIRCGARLSYFVTINWRGIRARYSSSFGFLRRCTQSF